MEQPRLPWDAQIPLLVAAEHCDRAAHPRNRTIKYRLGSCSKHVHCRSGTGHEQHGIGTSTQTTLGGPTANGTAALALGSSDGTSFSGALAATDRTISMGTGSQALAAGSIACGNSSTSVTGLGAIATASNAIAIGGANGSSSGASANGFASHLEDPAAAPAGATAYGNYSVAIGSGVVTSQPHTISMGTSIAGSLVGIGINAPTATVHVVGTSGSPVIQLDAGDATIASAPILNNPATSSGAGTPIQYNGSNQLFGFTSSKAVKTNIRPIEDAQSEVIYQLQPVLYDAKAGHGEGTDIPGLIAEDVYEKAPFLSIVFTAWYA